MRLRKQYLIKMFLRMTLVILPGWLMNGTLLAQEKKGIFKDTLDHNLDFSNYLINMHGFVPWPTIITEPALGNFGIGLAAVFMSPKKNVSQEEKFHFPDITALAGMYTLNNTWGVGVLRQGSVPAVGLRYQAGIGYANANMNFYRDLPNVGEQEYLFNLKPLVVNVEISENLYRNKIFLGMQYMFLRTWVSYDFPNLPDSVFDPKDFGKNLGLLSYYLEVDTRNTIFTPDRGIRFKTTFSFGRKFTGSDFNIQRGEMFLHVFIQPVKRWVCAFRAEGQAISDGAPFYDLPYLNMRGFPMMKYQGKQTLLFETEQRVDVTLRWSLVGFIGTGRTFSDSKYMSDETWHCAGGVGFRYLLARLFKLRMGVDLAVGPGQFAYYIVLGHYWNR